MPKNKTKGPETPAPVITPVPDIGQEARSLLLQTIDQQLADLERVAQDLLAVRKSLTATATSNMENLLGRISGAGNTQAGPAVRKRGRPPGSKNKPKGEGQGEGPGEGQSNKGQSSASPAADTDTFAQAVEATKPEHDKEFAA